MTSYVKVSTMLHGCRIGKVLSRDKTCVCWLIFYYHGRRCLMIEYAVCCLPGCRRDKNNRRKWLGQWLLPYWCRATPFPIDLCKRSRLPRHLISSLLLLLTQRQLFIFHIIPWSKKFYPQHHKLNLNISHHHKHVDPGSPCISLPNPLLENKDN